MTITIASIRTDRHAVPSAAPGIAVTFSVLLVATVWHAISYANTDIAWLLTVGEHVLDGAIPYRDIIETNPPGSVLLYLPAVLIGRVLGVDPQTVVMLLTGLACAASLAASAAVLRPVVPPRHQGPLLVLAAILLAILPTGSFGQREHFILMTGLPLLCRLAVRCGGAEPMPVLSGVAIAMVAALGLAVKPYYALGLVGAALPLWRQAGWRGLRDAYELWFAGGMALLLLTVQIVLFPAFARDILPLLTRVYLPMRLSLLDLLGLPGGAAALSGLIGCALVRQTMPRSTADRTVTDTAAFAALGFFAAYLLQGKGWAYHAYPSIAAALIAIATGLWDPVGIATVRLWVLRIGAVALAGWAAVGLDRHLDIDVEAPGLVEAVATLGPHPRVMSLAADLAVGHPLVRRVGGLWVGTLMSSWIDLYVDRIAPGAGRDGPLGSDLVLEDRIMASDIRDRHPDAVLADAPGWGRWIADAPAVAAALTAYRPAGTYGSVMLWTRKPYP